MPLSITIEDPEIVPVLDCISRAIDVLNMTMYAFHGDNLLVFAKERAALVAVRNRIMKEWHVKEWHVKGACVRLEQTTP